MSEGKVLFWPEGMRDPEVRPAFLVGGVLFGSLYGISPLLIFAGFILAQIAATPSFLLMRRASALSE